MRALTSALDPPRIHPCCLSMSSSSSASRRFTCAAACSHAQQNHDAVCVGDSCLFPKRAS